MKSNTTKEKIIDIIKAWFQRFYKKSVSNVEKLTIELDKKKAMLAQITESYCQYEGKRKFFEEEITTAQQKREQLVTAAKKCKADGKEDLLRRCFDEINVIDVRLISLRKTLELTTELSTKVLEQKNKAETRISQLTVQLDSLKMKNDFTQDVQKFSAIVSNDSEFDTGDFDSVAKEIAIDFHASEAKLDMAKAATSAVDTLEQVEHQSKYDEFVEKLG